MLMQDDSGTKLKRCATCKSEKPVSEFHKQKRKKDGLYSSCKVCTREAGRRWYAENKERAKETNRLWREANKDRKAETNRLWRAANKDRTKETNRLWRKENPKRDAYGDQKNHAQQRGIDFLLTFKEWCDWWGDDFCNRGCTKGKLVMARYGDEGPYQLGNIYKTTCEENVRDNHRFKNKALHKVQGRG